MGRRRTLCSALGDGDTIEPMAVRKSVEIFDWANPAVHKAGIHTMDVRMRRTADVPHRGQAEGHHCHEGKMADETRGHAGLYQEGSADVKSFGPVNLK